MMPDKPSDSVAERRPLCMARHAAECPAIHQNRCEFWLAVAQLLQRQTARPGYISVHIRAASWGRQMQKLLRAIAASVAVGVGGIGTAWAADMPVKAPVRAPAVVAAYN